MPFRQGGGDEAQNPFMVGRPQPAKTQQRPHWGGRFAGVHGQRIPHGHIHGRQQLLIRHPIQLA